VSTTGTTWAARDHARAQGGTVVETMPTVPASLWPDPPEGVSPADLVWAEVVAGDGATAKELAAGTELRLRDVEGGACAHVLLYHAPMPWERLNAADTVKIPWQAYLGHGHPLLSDQGRVLATIIADDSGRHDALCGGGAAGRAAMINLAAKHGLEPRDLPPSVSFFEGVRVGADGDLRFLGTAGAGRALTLRCELPLIVLIANVAHPVDPREDTVTTPLEVLGWRAEVTRPDNPLWSSTPELERAFLNTADLREARR
jgi:uncharacterized protein YcgI (DUF1989 family)